MTYDITIFGIDLSINPIAFTLGGWKIYWYGIIIAVGFIAAMLFGMKKAPKFGLNTDRILDVILVTTPVAILCARVYYVIFYEEEIDGIKGFFGFGNGSGFSGLAIYGGVIGAFLCGAIMCYLRKVKILDMFDLAALGFLIGQGIGRWGNFFNQEAYGDFTNSSWWGMQSTRTISEVGYGLVHPCFLYESVWCITGFFIINKLSQKRRFSGEVTLMYCVWYGFGRAIIEQIRTDSLYIGSLKVSQLVSVIIFAGAGVALIVLRKKFKAEKAEPDYVPQFAEQFSGDAESGDENVTEEAEICEFTEENEVENDAKDN